MHLCRPHQPASCQKCTAPDVCKLIKSTASHNHPVSVITLRPGTPNMLNLPWLNIHPLVSKTTQYTLQCSVERADGDTRNLKFYHHLYHQQDLQLQKLQENLVSMSQSHFKSAAVLDEWMNG